MSVEYSIETAYGIIVADDDSSVIASEILAAYCDSEYPRLAEINITKLQKDYSSLNVGSAFDSWSGSIKENVIFHIADTRKNLNPRDSAYDAFYIKELNPSDEAKAQLKEFAARFGITDEPGICIWSSVF